MQTKTEDVIAEMTSEINSSPTNRAFEAVLKKYAKIYGADSYFFGTSLFHDLSVDPDVCTCSNYPDEWQKRYTKKDYFNSDLTVDHCKYKNTPIFWPKPKDNISNINKKIFSEAAEFGLISGISFPFHANNNGDYGAFAVAVPKDCQEIGLGSCNNLFALQVLGATAFDFTRLKARDETRNILTERQKECLKWVAAGKTTWEISQIIGISESTVIFHIQNAASKMDTASRIHAVVIALLNGEIKL